MNNPNSTRLLIPLNELNESNQKSFNKQTEFES